MSLNPKNFRVQNLSPRNFKGECINVTAGGTLLVGDVVYWTTSGTVNKSSTAADYAAFAGVVVTGQALNFIYNQDDDTGVGATAATVGQQVIVQISGIAMVVSAAALAIHTRLQVVTTAGQVDDAAFTAGQTVGIALAVAGGASVKIPMLIQPK